MNHVNSWAKKFGCTEVMPILKENGYDNLFALSQLREQDIKSWKISPGAAKKLLFGTEQIAKKLESLLNGRQSISLLGSFFTCDCANESSPNTENNDGNQNELPDESPGTVHVGDFTICVSSDPDLNPTKFITTSRVRNIFLNVMGGIHRAVARNVYIVKITSPTGTVYQTPGLFDTVFLSEHPNFPGKISAAHLWGARAQPGLWTAEIRREVPVGNFPELPDIPEVDPTIWVHCVGYPDKDYKDQGLAMTLWNACIDNPIVHAFMLEYKFPALLGSNSADWMCQYCVWISVGVVALNCFAKTTPPANALLDVYTNLTKYYSVPLSRDAIIEVIKRMWMAGHSDFASGLFYFGNTFKQCKPVAMFT